MNVLRRLERLIVEAPTWLFITVVITLACVKTGIWNMPILMVTRLVALDPFSNPFSDQLQHYLYWNWLGPFFASLINATDPAPFGLFHLALSVAFTSVFMVTAMRRFPRTQARLSIILFSALPVSGTIYFWVGMDSLTLLLMLVALIRHDRLSIVVLAGLGLGMQHFEQGFVAFAALAIMAVLAKGDREACPFSIGFCVVILASILGGKAILLALFQLIDATVNSGRVHWIDVFLPRLLTQFFLHTQYILWSVFGVGWLAVLHLMEQGRRRTYPFFAALIPLLFLLPIVEDQTRVIAIVTFPIVVSAWLLNAHFLATISAAKGAFFLLLWAICPWAWVWRGIPRWSEFPYDIVQIMRTVFGVWLEMPVDSMLGPL